MEPALLKNWLDRKPATQLLAATLQEHQTCVLHGSAGVGMRTVAANYARSIPVSRIIRWITADSTESVLEGYHQLACDLRLDLKSIG